MSEYRVGDWMQTYTGKMFWPMDPRPEEVDIEDIAHALSNICRYGGHCTQFYSVAQHCVLVSNILTPEYKLWGLLHDAAEAYIMDVIRPIKPFLEGYKNIESAIEKAIAIRFGLSTEIPQEVKRADEIMLATEMQRIMVPPPQQWQLSEKPITLFIDYWSPEEAKQRFLTEYYFLTVKRQQP